MGFNKKDLYSKEIKGKVQEIIEFCNENKIPVFMSFAVKDEDGVTDYENTVITANSAEVLLSDDKIKSFLNVTNGFKTIPYEKIGINDESTKWMDTNGLDLSMIDEISLT